MARINLLPWRAERRKQRQKEFGIMLAAAAGLALLVSFLIVTYYNMQISGQNERNAFLQSQIDEVKRANAEIATLEAKRAGLLARKEVIEKLQADRSTMVHLFDSLVRTIPDGVMLTAIKQDQQVLTLDGRAQSNARVSTYLRNLETAGWLTSPELSRIEAQGNDAGLPFVFNLTVRLANPNAPVDTDGDGVPDAPPAASVVPASDAVPASDPANPAVPAVVPAPAGAAPAPAPGATPAAAPAPAPAAPPAAAPPQPAPTPAAAPAGGQP